MDLLASGAGGEVTDQSFRSSSALTKPWWTLAPLPLSHIRPGYTFSRTVLPSLQSLALNAISTHFHLYSPSDLVGLPPHLKTRIIERIKGDRGYDLDADRETHRPDEATLWAFQTLLDPSPLEEHTRSVTLGLPTALTIRHLAPNPTLSKPDHPLNEFPRLFKSIHAHETFTLLTSLSLGGLEGGVSDQTIMSLRYCTHLSILWMRKCAVSDDGIRMLATSLDLPGSLEDWEHGSRNRKGKGKEEERGLGMWRLRAWYLQGCRLVTDKSMQWFARWPGLVLLDVRDTSCTSASAQIFNRTSRALFSCQNADFQPCTPGLLPLFATVATPRYIADRLCILLGPKYASGDPFSLHVVPSWREIRPDWLPPGTLRGPVSHGDQYTARNQKTVFRGNGVGQIYGAGVAYVADEVSSFRKDVKTALFLTSRDEEEDRDPAKKRKRIKEEREMWSNWSNPKYKVPPPGKKDKDPFGRASTILAGKKFRLKPGDADVIGPMATHDHSRTAYAMKKMAERESAEEEKVKGDMDLMLVRMVSENWEELQWSQDAAAELRRIALARPAPAPSSSPEAAPFQSSQSASTSTYVKVKARGDFLEDILSTQSNTALQLKVQPVASAFRPSQSSRQAQSTSQYSQSSQASQRLSSPPLSSSPASHKVSSNPFKSKKTSVAVGTKPLAPSVSSPSNNVFGDFAGFSSTKKRSFQGAGSGDETKRRGMKMFSGVRRL